MKKFYWTGITREERQKALHEFTQLVSRYGSVVHFLRYSDLALGISIEIEECRLAAFYAELQAIMHMEGICNECADSSAEVLVLIHISFLQGTGDLEIENLQISE